MINSVIKSTKLEKENLLISMLVIENPIKMIEFRYKNCEGI